MRTSSSIARVLVWSLSLLACGCADQFSTARTTPPRGTLGTVLYGVACDRVGAQSLPADVTGLSFQNICHPDPVTGAYGTTVDVSLIPPLQDPAYTADGTLVPIAQQEINRSYEIARVEALGRDRDKIIAALDAALPDTSIPIVPPAAGTTPCTDASGAAPPTSGTAAFPSELAATLSRLIDLYDDADLTLPSATRAVGRSLDDVKADPDVQGALARLDARQGYRPLPIALGTVRSVLSYPRLVEMVRAVVTPMLSVDGQPEGPEAQAFDQMLQFGYEELRTPGDPSPIGDLNPVKDPKVPYRTVVARPRTFAEGIRDVLTYPLPGAQASSPDFIVQRDWRGYAAVPLVNGALPAPFVDMTGPSGTPDGLPDIDALGQFVSSGGPIPSPFFTPDGTDGTRDNYGRASVYGYVDAYQTALAAITQDVLPYFAPGVTVDKETAMDGLAALPVLAGTRDPTPTSSIVYPPDPYAAQDWQVGHAGAPPAGLTSKPVTLQYRAFHPETSPIADLVYAFGQVLATPEMDDLLALAQDLFTNHQADMASLMGLALEIRQLAHQHPEAQLPDASTIWDDLFARLAPVAHEPGLLEDFLRGFADPATFPLEQGLETFLTMKDDLAYNSNDLNGPSIDLDTMASPPSYKTPVDRTQPDVGNNRSELQKFLSLLHDTNGLSICTKDGAIVHIKNLPLPAPLNGIAFNYPADDPNATAPNFLSAAMCTVFGSTAPAHLPRCAVFGYQNVMSLLLDVLLDKAQLEVNDPCLDKLMTSSFVQSLGDGSQYGGANKFLQAMAGVQGFSLQPNLRGFARLLYFQTPYPVGCSPSGPTPCLLPVDPNAANDTIWSQDTGLNGMGITNGGGKLTSDFLQDTIDPIESMVCDVTPFTTSTGQVYPLRKCKTVDDTLRARDANALFPVDEGQFVPSLRPLANAFDKHHQPILFANLWDVLHLHYGSTRQPASVCDPTRPRSDARWCSQDALVSYEPLLAEVLKNGFFARIQAFLNTLAGMTVTHCTAKGPNGLCTTPVTYDGVHVVAEVMSLLMDPLRTPGLVDRHGSAFATRNDGQKTDPLSAMELIVQAFRNMDLAFNTYQQQNPTDTGRLAMWRDARSNFVDTFLTVNGKGPQATWADSTLIGLLPQIIDVLRQQVGAHCPNGGACQWSQHDLPANLSTTLGGPMFAASVDLAEALRKNNGARSEIEQLVTYLLSSASANQTKAGALASILDMTQTLEDGTNLTPFERVFARAVEPPITDEAGHVVQRSLADAGMRALSKIFEIQQVSSGGSVCEKERDPNRVVASLMSRLVTPMAPDQLTPIEVLMDAIGDVNRADPSKTTKFAGDDYGNLSNEMSEFFLDSTRGLEQLYAVVRQITNGT